MIVAHRPGYGLDEYALAVAAAAPQEQQDLFTGRAGQRVAAADLQEADQLLIASRHRVEEVHQERTRPARFSRRHHRAVVVRQRRPDLAGFQIDHAAGRAELPDVGIPLLRPAARRWSSLTSPSTPILVLLLAIFSLVGALRAQRGFAADRPRHVEGLALTVLGPTLSVP